MFSKREYEYVMEIAKEGSFSKAAQNLYISQPALSGAIKKIEKEYRTDSGRYLDGSER